MLFTNSHILGQQDYDGLRSPTSNHLTVINITGSCNNVLITGILPFIFHPHLKKQYQYYQPINKTFVMLCHLLQLNSLNNFTQ